MAQGNSSKVFDEDNFRPVVPEEFDALIRKADRVVVLEPWMQGPKVFYESEKQADIVELAESIQVRRPESEFVCACCGGPQLRLFKGSELLVCISHHHGYSVACDLWTSHAPLVEPDKLLDWFDKRGIDGPRRELEEAERLRGKET